MHAWKDNTIRMTLLAAMALVFCLTSAATVSAQSALTLNAALRQTDETSAALTQARRDWQAAKQAQQDALADMGWRFTATTNRSWSVAYDPEDKLTATLHTNLEFLKSPVPGQTISLSTASQADVAKGTTEHQWGPVTLGWSIAYPFGRQSAQALSLKQLARTVEQRSANLDQLRITTLIDTAELFYEVGKAVLDVDLAAKQLSVQELELERQHALAQVGRLAEHDVAIAAQRLELAKLELAAKQRQERLAWRNLSRAMGNAETVTIESQWIEPAWPTPEPGELAQWLNNLEANPRIRQAELAVQAARDAVAAAEAPPAYTVKPLVSYDTATAKLNAGLDIAKVRESDNDFNTSTSLRVNADSWSITTSFSAEFGGAAESRKQKAANAMADLADAERRLQEAKEDLQEQISVLWANLNARIAQYELQGSLLARERLSLQIAQKQAEFGAVTPKDVADAELSLLKAEIEAKKALYDLQLAYLELLAAARGIEAMLEVGGTAGK